MLQLNVLTRAIVMLSLCASVSAFADTTIAPVTAKLLAPVVKPVVAAVPAASLAPEQKILIDQEIRAYLLAHPEILMEMSEKLQAKQQQDMLDKANKVIPANVALLAHDPQSPVTGNAAGKVTVIEFFDYQCPHCKSMVPAIDGLVLANKDVRIVYKEMPIFGPASEFASRAALAANKQGKYQAFHLALMKTEGRLTNQQILDTAKSIGLDINKLQAVMNSPEISKELQENGQLAQMLGLPGTPAFVVLTDTAGVVNSRFIPGQTDQAALQQAVNAVSAVAPVKAAVLK